MDSHRPLHRLRSGAQAEDFVQVEFGYETKKLRVLRFQDDLQINKTIK